MLTEQKISTDKKLLIELLKREEPNNGRFLRQVNVFYQQININDKIFGNKWNCVNDSLYEWVLEDPSGQFYYIPVEGSSKLIVKKEFKIIDIPCKNLSAAGFHGNSFQYGHLIQVWSDLIVITNLSTLETSKVHWQNKRYISSVKMVTDNKLSVDCYTIKNEEVLKKSILMTIKR